MGDAGHLGWRRKGYRCQRHIALMDEVDIDDVPHCPSRRGSDELLDTEIGPVQRPAKNTILLDREEAMPIGFVPLEIGVGLTVGDDSLDREAVMILPVFICRPAASRALRSASAIAAIAMSST